MDVVGGVLVAGVLVAMYAYGYLAHRHNERLRATGERVRGVIVQNKLHLGRTAVFRPVVRFTTRAGAVLELEDEKGVALAFPRFAVGTAVWVAYDKQNPRDFVVLTPGRYE